VHEYCKQGNAVNRLHMLYVKNATAIASDYHVFMLWPFASHASSSKNKNCSKQHMYKAT
jgi:hypothetical protein